MPIMFRLAPRRTMQDGLFFARSVKYTRAADVIKTV